MIREELLHPALSHFPIAFLATALVGNFVSFKWKHPGLAFMNEILLYAGAILLLPTLFLGDMSLEIVKPDLCRLTLASEHEEMGELTLILAILSAGTQIVLKLRPIIWLRMGLLMALAATNYTMILTGHKGSQLVYEDGAAVQRPLGDCPSL